MAVSEKDRATLNEAGIKGIEAATKKWEAAKKAGDAAGMTAAHNEAEAIRNSAGYTSDSWGRNNGGSSGGGNASSPATKPASTPKASTPAPQTTQTNPDFDTFRQQQGIGNSPIYKDPTGANIATIPEGSYVATADGLKFKTGNQLLPISSLWNSDNIKNTVYTPLPGSTSTPAAPRSGGTNTGTTPAQSTQPAQSNLPIYKFGSEAGSNIYNTVKQTGQSQEFSNGDGKRLVASLAPDGEVYIYEKESGTRIAKAQNTFNGGSTGGAEDSAIDGNDTAAIIAAMMAMFGNQDNSYSKQYLNQQKAANDAAVQQAINSINQQKTASEQSYANLFRQLYINKMLARKNLDQEMAAQGLTGGATETTKLGLETGYADALRQGGIERINTLSGLDQAIANARLSGDISYAKTAAQAAQNNLQSYAGVLQNLLSRADQQESLNRSTAYQVSMQILGNGNMPDDATLAAAGIRKSDAQMLMDAAVKANGTQYSSSQAQTALMAAANGNRSDAVRKIVESVYGLPLETVLLAYGYR